MAKKLVRYKNVNGALVKQCETPALEGGKVDIGWLPVVGAEGSAIISEGENANGRWVRFANGLQICATTKQIDLSIIITDKLPFNASLTWGWILPIEFSSSEKAVALSGGWYSGGVGEGLTQITLRSVGYATGRLWSNTNITNAVISFNVIVIGRWK